MPRIIIKVFDGSDNVSLVLFEEGEGNPIDFSAATQFTLEVDTKTIDTLVGGEENTILATANLGELQFDLGAESMPIGIFPATLKVFDVSHPNGQILACSDDMTLYVQTQSC
jgi:hypothetical protein